MSRILIVSDLHEPSSRLGALEFCKDLRDKHKTDTTIFIGDVTDWHSISFHAHHPEMPGPKDEFELAFECLQKWYEVFPDATICLGNHDRRIVRLAESVNIPARFIRGFGETWETPGWNWIDEIVIDDVLYTHGDGQGGSMYPAYNMAKGMGMSCVIGHHHSAGGNKWLVNPLRRTFGLDTGALVDDKALAFAYNKKSIKRSVLSAAVVIDGVPQHIIMPCSRDERYWDGNFKKRKRKRKRKKLNGGKSNENYRNTKTKKHSLY